MIYFVGDPHGRWDLVVPPLLDRRPTAVVLLGDMELQRPLHIELKDVIEAGIDVYFIPGNHDADDPTSFSHLIDSDLSGNNISGQVRPIAGHQVAGLGGVFRSKIWNPNANPEPIHRNVQSLRRASRVPKDGGLFRDGVAIKHHVSIWPDDYECLRRGRADVLVLHEAPETHENGFRALGELAEAMRVRLVVHGHHHRSYRGTTEKGVAVVGVALAGIVDLDGGVISPGVTPPCNL